MKDNTKRVQFEALSQSLLDNLANPIKKHSVRLVTFPQSNLYEEGNLRHRVYQVVYDLVLQNDI